MVRSHIQPSWTAGVVPPPETAVVPSAVLRRSPSRSLAAGVHRLRAGSQNRWLAVVWMTWTPCRVLTFRLYRSWSWLTSTAATVSALVLPVLVLVARTLSPGLRLEIGFDVPPARSTRVLAV